MSPQVTIEIAELQNKTVNQLVQRYEQIFNEQCRSRNKPYLIRRIAWRLQANAEGGLTRAALKKAEQLAVDAQTRVTAPRKHSADGVKLVVPEPTAFVDWDPRLPPPGINQSSMKISSCECKHNSGRTASTEEIDYPLNMGVY